MSNIIEIHDLSDPEIAVYAQLTEAQLKSMTRPEDALFIAESPVVIGYALDAGYEPVSMLMERKHIAGKARTLVERCGDMPVYTADDDVLSALTGYPLTRGVLSAMRRPEPSTVEDVCRGARRVAVLEGLVDATNVGVIFRCAAALGLDAVLLSPTCCDPLNRRAVRVSMGSVFQLPWARFDAWPEGGVDSLREMGFTTVAMALTDDSVSIDDPMLLDKDKLAIVLGTEGDGLKGSTLARCDCVARIPMAHGVDSLNVGAAAAVAFWQLRARPQSRS